MNLAGGRAGWLHNLRAGFDRLQKAVCGHSRGALVGQVVSGAKKPSTEIKRCLGFAAEPEMVHVAMLY